MTTLKDYIEQGSKVLGTKGELCEHLGVSRQALNKAEHTGSMDADNCIALAGILGIHPAQVLEAASNARKPEYAKYWRVACVATVIMSVALTANEAINTGVFANSLIDVTIYYAHIEQLRTLSQIIVAGIASIMVITIMNRKQGALWID